METYNNDPNPDDGNELERYLRITPDDAIDVLNHETDEADNEEHFDVGLDDTPFALDKDGMTNQEREDLEDAKEIAFRQLRGEKIRLQEMGDDYFDDEKIKTKKTIVDIILHIHKNVRPYIYKDKDGVWRRK